jgi:HTH-type transcriptional regulator / antitoxin HipB
MISWGQKMLLEHGQLLKLADGLKKERKRQGLSREQAASVCNVSTSFIRDAEADPENCTLGLLLKLLKGLGLRVNVNGWHGEFGSIDEYPSADQSPPEFDAEMDKP